MYGAFHFIPIIKNGRTRHTLAIVSVLLFLPAQVYATEPSTLMAEQLVDVPFEQLLTLEVSSASRYPQKISEAPSAAVVVTADEIRTYGHRTLADILRTMPGLYINSDNTWDYISVRGFSRPGDYNTRVLLLVDGYRVNDNIFNQAYIGNEFMVDVDMIERVEFIPGPGASAYGDNAFLGVINVITKSASSMLGSTATVEAGSQDSYKTGYRYGGKFDNGAELVASGTAYASHGQSRFYPEFGAREHGVDDEHYGKFFAKFSFEGWALEGGYMKRPKRNPGAPYGVEFSDSRMETVDTHAFINTSYTTALSDKLNVSGNVYYGMYNYDGDYPYASGLNVDETRGRRAGAEARLISTHFTAHKLMAGIEYQQDLRQDQRNYDISPQVAYFDSQSTPTKYGVFAQDEITLRDDLLLNVGVRYDHYSQFGGTINPRLALIYHTSPGNSLKLIYGSAYRAPNAYEMFYGSATNPASPQKGNANLDPETIRTYEAVLEKTFNSGWHSTLSLYHYEIKDLISQEIDPIDGKLVFFNEGEVRTNGVELSADKSWETGIRFKGNVSYQEAIDTATDKILDNSPRILSKFSLSTPLPGREWRAGLEVQYTGSRHTNLDEADSYTVANLTLNRSNLLPKLDVSVGAYNLLDEKYYDPADPNTFIQDELRQDGRSVRVKLDYRF
jgi:outer membrane receptor protein involved in Fe transport